MAHKFDWGTPKHIQVEADQPRAPRRRKLSQRGRRKGPKARMDELVSAVRELKHAKERLAQAEVREQPNSWWNRMSRECVERAQARFDEVKRNMIRDGISTGNL